MEAVADGAEDLVRAGGGFPSRRVVVERDQHVRPAEIGSLAERCGLPAGQGGAAGSQADVAARVGQDDGDRVEWSFHDDGCCASTEVITGVVEAEQQVALVVCAGGGAVQVFRYVRVGAGAGAADETGERPLLVVDGQHDPVSEVIDEGPAGGDSGQPGGLDRVVWTAVAAEVVG